MLNVEIGLGFELNIWQCAVAFGNPSGEISIHILYRWNDNSNGPPGGPGHFFHATTSRVSPDQWAAGGPHTETAADGPSARDVKALTYT